MSDDARTNSNEMEEGADAGQSAPSSISLREGR